MRGIVPRTLDAFARTGLPRALVARSFREGLFAQDEEPDDVLGEKTERKWRSRMALNNFANLSPAFAYCRQFTCVKQEKTALLRAKFCAQHSRHLRTYQDMLLSNANIIRVSETLRSPTILSFLDCTSHRKRSIYPILLVIRPSLFDTGVSTPRIIFTEYPGYSPACIRATSSSRVKLTLFWISKKV